MDMIFFCSVLFVFVCVCYVCFCVFLCVFVCICVCMCVCVCVCVWFPLVFLCLKTPIGVVYLIWLLFFSLPFHFSPS